jgi:hypothetical protein
MVVRQTGSEDFVAGDGDAIARRREKRRAKSLLGGTNCGARFVI